ncbi:glycosyltransferase family 4 protein [Deinococcus alpinitundrae]|uniref:glycosyltransferase family 4 protein n=1 Tax=Deinococcus alpinitundrae TaxID=468913 RepID=UPI00137A95AF|nr:glycosyltransferase family 4 protein [Deinococcus alpinitundrae]
MERDRNNLKVAVIHEWLVTHAGSERVLERMLTAFPQADLFSLVDFLGPEQRGFIGHRSVTTSFLQHLPKARTAFRQYLPLMPLAIEQFDLSGYDLILSSSHAVAKGVLTGPEQLHVCMCYSPVRYAWDLQHQYLRESGLEQGVKGAAARAVLHYIRLWDTRTEPGVDLFISISDFIAKRVRKVYRRPSLILYPPVDTSAFTPAEERDNIYMTASRMVPYKRIDLIVEAFSRMPDKRLVVIGDGPEMPKIRALAAPNVTIMGYQPFDVMREQMRRARAFIFAAEEDFGIAPIEAQACGTPVIAYGRGGAVETIRDGETGLFFEEQTPRSLMDAVFRFEDRKTDFNPAACRENALRFSNQRFDHQFRQAMDAALLAWQSGRNPEDLIAPLSVEFHGATLERKPI